MTSESKIFLVSTKESKENLLNLIDQTWIKNVELTPEEIELLKILLINEFYTKGNFKAQELLKKLEGLK